MVAKSRASGGLPDCHYLVTGIASGIGEAVGMALLEGGARVTGVDVQEPTVEVDRFSWCDLRDEEGIRSLVDELEGPVHGLCNAAGLSTSRSPHDIMAVNFFGLRRLTDLVIPLLEDGGSVVNVASCAGTDWPNSIDIVEGILATPTTEAGLEQFGRLGFSSVDAYRLSKECVTVYSFDVATTAVDRQIRVNTVSPGAIYTPILDEFYATMDEERLGKLRNVAGGREGYPSEVANPIVFLLSSGASWVNGVNLLVDGGAETAVIRGRLP